MVTVLGPNNQTIASVTAPAAGQAAVIETIAISTGGVYTIQVSDAGGNTGAYSIQAELNAYVKTGTSNVSIGTAQDLSSSSIALGSGTADRLAVVGSLPTRRPDDGRCLRVVPVLRLLLHRPAISDILRVNGQGQIVQVIPIGTDDSPYLSLSGVELDPANNMLYAAVTTSFNGYGGPATARLTASCSSSTRSPASSVATIPLPVDNAKLLLTTRTASASPPTAASGSRSRTATTSSTWTPATTSSPATRRRVYARERLDRHRW